MSSEVIKILDELCARFGIAIDWTSENVVPQLEVIADKLVRYECATSIMWLIIGVVVIAAGLFIAIADMHLDWDGFGVIIGSFIIGGGLIVSVTQIIDIIACNTFPEKILIDYLTIYMNGGYR